MLTTCLVFPTFMYLLFLNKFSSEVYFTNIFDKNSHLENILIVDTSSLSDEK